MDAAIENHDVYLHIRVIIGVVLGLCLTRILAGLSRLVQHPGRTALYPTHLLWVGIILISAIHFWWWEFELIRIGPWRFELFAFVLFYAFLYYLLASLLFPDDLQDYTGYKDYFISRRRWFFSLMGITFIVDYFDTLAKGVGRLQALGAEYEVKLTVCVILCAIAAWTRNQRFHLAFAAIYLIYYISWILRVFDNIG